MVQFKSGDKVEFTVGPGPKVYRGVMVNPSYYPGGSRAGKHYRINVGGMVATIFANGPVGKSVRREDAKPNAEFAGMAAKSLRDARKVNA